MDKEIISSKGFHLNIDDKDAKNAKDKINLFQHF